MTSRVAESFYWLGRYLERTYHLSYLIQVVETLETEELNSAERKLYRPMWNRLLPPLDSKSGPGRRSIVNREERYRLLLFPQAGSVSMTLSKAMMNAESIQECLSPEAWATLSNLLSAFHRSRFRRGISEDDPVHMGCRPCAAMTRGDTSNPPSRPSSPLPARRTPSRSSSSRFGDSLTAGYRLPPEDGLSRQARGRAESEAATTSLSPMPASPATRRRRGSRGRLVGAGRDGRRDPGTRRQRRAARHRPRRRRAGTSTRSPTRLQERGIRRARRRHAGAAQYGRGLSRKSSTRSSRTSRRRHDFVLYPFFLDGVAADPSLNLDDGMHPTARASTSSSSASCPMSNS